ncbi:hypothetical protein NX783_18495 [Massilia kyonggiensis]|jgi:hypothetical protein|nr:hypothetical protein [Massilia kyonggiensis]
MKKLHRKYWWVELACLMCAIFLVNALLRAAGLEAALPGTGSSLARFAVWACCLFAVERALRFALWAVVAVVAPARAADMP